MATSRRPDKRSGSTGGSEGTRRAAAAFNLAGVFDLCGSYESFYRDDVGNAEQWPIPNVLGVVSRARE